MQETILLFLSLSGLFLGHHASLAISKSYYHVDQKLSWTDAQQHCREWNGDLATVDNVADLQHLQESRTGFDYDFMWIGLYDDRTSWKWSLGNQDYKFGQNYGTWHKQNPDFWDNKENCTLMLNTGHWYDVSCYKLHHAVCFDDPHYISVEIKMTWYEALQYCRSNYTDLASVPNATENSKVLALNTNSVWIGLHRYPWSHWSDGSRATFLNWGPGEPNSYAGPIAPRCVKMSVTSGDFLDEECGSLYNFACQGPFKQRSTFKLRISSDADMMCPEVERQILEKLYVKLAEMGVTGTNISWVLNRCFTQPSKT